jgi:hypothetical protein
MSDDCSRRWEFTDSQLLAHFNLVYSQSRPWQLCQLRKQMRSSLTSALLTSVSDPVLPLNAPRPWITIGADGTHCVWNTTLIRTSGTGLIRSPSFKSLASNIGMDDPPLKKPVKSRTVEDALRAMGQAHARLGALDPRKYGHGGIDFRIQRQLKAYKKDDAPSKRVKPIPILIIIYTLAQAYGDQRNDPELAIADMITIAFFFLLRPGEFTGTPSDDTPFRLQDVGLYIGPRNLDLTRASDAELDSATSVLYTFTTQKNGVKDEKVVQGPSGNGLCFPVRASIWQVRYHRWHKSKPAAPIASFYRDGKRVAIKARDVTDVLCHATTIKFHRSGIPASDISARSLYAGGAMAMLVGSIDLNNICMMGRWHSDAMMHYLHIQAQPIIGNYASIMFNDGAYTFQPDETVPIIDAYDV